MIKHCIGCYVNVCIPFETRLRRQTLVFANLSNFVALLGGKIKVINQYLVIWQMYYLICT